MLEEEEEEDRDRNVDVTRRRNLDRVEDVKNYTSVARRTNTNKALDLLLTRTS